LNCAQGIEAEILFAERKKIGADSPVFARRQTGKNAPLLKILAVLKGFLFAVTLALLASCQARTAHTGNAGAEQPAGGGIVRFTDDAGAEIELEAPRKRIIALYSAHTENLFWLGAGASLIGGHKTCTWPPEAASFARYDYTGDPEYIIAAAPDLVLTVPRIHRSVPDYITELKKAGIPVVSLYCADFDGFDEYIRRLALLAGVDASERLSEFHRRLDEIRAKTAAVPPGEKQRVFFETTENNYRTAAPDSFPARALEFAGLVNIAAGAQPIVAGSSISPFGVERLMEKAADIDLYVAQHGPMNPATAASIRSRPGFTAIKAVAEGRILIIDEKLISSPTSRFLEGVAALSRFAYPALDWDE
jgi:iron complex transport system substrate-binding protein